MKNYRLKKEAVPYFKEKYSTRIEDLNVWEQMGVDEKALEEVEDVHIKYGKKFGENGTSLSGWSDSDGSKFEFTIIFPSTKMKEHDEFNNGKIIRTLMDKIQSISNQYFKDFVNQ